MNMALSAYQIPLAPAPSIMPRKKKNPDMAGADLEVSGRVYGHLFSLLTVMKSLPLAYNKDLQEDKGYMSDTVDTIKKSLDIMEGMLSSKYDS